MPIFRTVFGRAPRSTISAPSTRAREAVADRLRHLVCSIAEAQMAVALGVVRSTLDEWAKAHPEFSDAITRAREADAREQAEPSDADPA